MHERALKMVLNGFLTKSDFYLNTFPEFKKQLYPILKKFHLDFCSHTLKTLKLNFFVLKSKNNRQLFKFCLEFQRTEPYSIDYNLIDLLR